MQPLGSLRRVTFGLLAAGILLSPVFGQSFDRRHQQDVAGNPKDLHFSLGTSDGKRAFRIGERIPLTLRFSSDSPDKYKLNGATYDRSGRLPTEEFVLDREDLVDPYQDYFGSAVLGGFAGGLRGYPVLESKPYEIGLDLNDWFRFDRPGRYRLYLKSHRLTRERRSGESGEGTIPFAGVSNIIEIEILPEDRAWQLAKLREIRGILDQPEPVQPKPGGPPVPYDPLEEKMALARRELRYLGTPDAVQLSLDHARKTADSPDALLLVGARDRPLAVAAFDRFLADPEVGLQAWDIRVRALFTLMRKDAPKPLPMFQWQLPQGSDLQQLQAIVESRQNRFDEMVREEAIQLIPVADKKTDAARKISGKAIASVAPEAAKAARLVPPDDYGLSRGELIAQFPGFPPEQQSELLGKKWDLVRGPEMIPALLSVIGKIETRDLPDDAGSLRVWGMDTGIGESALRRLTEVSPEEIARILREDISSGKPRFAGFAVREFPAQDIPESDQAFSTLLKTHPKGVLPLVAKFATARLADQMRELYLSESWPCAEEESFITYFVRTLPEKGVDGGADLLKRAMANREQRGCYSFLLGQIAQTVWNSTIEREAIATLDDSDPEAASNAAHALAQNGGPEVEPFLWKRLERWEEQWRAQAAELKIHPITGGAPNPQANLGSALTGAISSAKSWLFDEPRRKRLVALCVDERCRDYWGQERAPGTIPVEAFSGGPSYPTGFRVDGYQSRTIEGLKKKLQQFTAGTEFRWCPQASNPFDAFSPAQREEMFKELSAFLSERSMSIEPYSEEKCVPGFVDK